MKNATSSSYLCVIDEGTTSSRALLFDGSGNLLAMTQEDIQQYYPKPGWVEHSPQEIWESVLKNMKALFQKTSLTPKDILGLGITNQRETTILWERATGKPIYPAIVWQDRRNSALCEAWIREGHEPVISRKTGLLLDPYFSALKIHWILSEVPGAREKAEKGELAFGTMDTYLLWQLTGGRHHTTDITNASRTLLFNIHTKTWDEELLSFFNIPFSLLPEVKENTAHFGDTLPPLFGGSIPIVAMMGDQQAAAVGQACFSKGMIKSTYGTGCFMVLNTGKEVVSSKHRLLSTVLYQIGNEVHYALEGSIFMAGAIIQWLRDEMKWIRESKDCEALAKEVKDNGGVYLVPAFTGMGAPYWDPLAKGAILGLTRDTKIPHIVRAALEAVCYQTRDLLRAMEEEGIQVPSLRVDGGMTKNEWLLQCLADQLNRPILRSSWVETTALGIAYLIGVQRGLYEHGKDHEGLWREDKIFKPSKERAQAEKDYEGWLKAVKQVVVSHV